MSETEGKWVDEESLAMALHEAGREAVEKGITVSAQKFGEEARRYTEWDELAEPAKEGRRMQAAGCRPASCLSATGSPGRHRSRSRSPPSTMTTRPWAAPSTG